MTFMIWVNLIRKAASPQNTEQVSEYCEAISALQDNGIEVYADIVLDHRLGRGPDGKCLRLQGK